VPVILAVGRRSDDARPDAPGGDHREEHARVRPNLGLLAWSGWLAVRSWTVI
jgi:hypothetical protein